MATSSGNVGIGTTSPNGQLVVATGPLLVGTNTTDGSSIGQFNGNVLATGSAGAYPRYISTIGAKSWEIGYRSGTTNYEIREDGTTQFAIANGGAATFSSTLGINGVSDNVKGGTYTPTATAITNVTSSSTFNSQYTRLGNIVTVYGIISVTATSSGATTIDISLPVASNLTGGQDFNGIATGDITLTANPTIQSNTTDDRAIIQFAVPSSGTQTIRYSFSYEVK